MAVNWQEASEVVTGLLFEGRVAQSAVRYDLLMPPYDKIARLIIEERAGPEDIALRVGIAPIHACLESVSNLNGVGEADWLAILETTANNYKAGIEMEKLAQKLQRGEQIDWSRITYYAGVAQRNQAGDFMPISAIEDTELPFIETGMKSIDTHLCGIPATGVISVGGLPGSGKTWFWITLSSQFVKRHKDARVAFFSIEMMLPEIKARYSKMDLSRSEEDRILVNPHPVVVEEVVSKSAAVSDLGLVGIDFADLLVRGETTTSSMEHIYRVLMLGAKNLGVPIVLLAQLSNYHGDVPKPNNFRWTRLAEGLAWMIIMPYNPNTDWFGGEAAENNNLPRIKNTAYLCCWKVRGGFRKHPDDSPGAILLGFKGHLGWNPNEEGRWFKLHE